MGTPEFDPVWGKELAKACAAAYADSADAIALECCGERVETFSYGPVFGYVAHLDQNTVVAFRGTVSPVDEWERALMQWIANIDYHQIAALGGRVHRGFFHALDAVWLPFHDLVKSHLKPDSRLWITGHSLGGALAILAAIRLQEAGIETAGIYTFGAPAVGDIAFASGYKPALHRVENSCDIVCHLPPPKALTHLVAKLIGSLGIPTDVEYYPVGTVTVFHESGRFRTSRSLAEQKASSWLRLLDQALAVSTDLSAFLDDHRITNYVSRLGKGQSQRAGILFEIPTRLLKAFGKLRTASNRLRDASGRIVAFLQETGGWQKAIGGGRLGGLIQNAGVLVTALRADPQVGQIASAMSNLRLLSATNLAASVLGIGINVAEFALVLNRLKSVAVIANETKTAAIGARLAAERAEMRGIIRERACILHLLESADAAWVYSDPVSEWKELRKHLHKQMAYEQCLVGKCGTRSIFLDGRFFFEEAVEAYESTLLLNAAHFQTLLLTSEENAALFHAEAFHKWHWDEVVSKLRADDIAGARAKISEPDVRSKLRRQAEDFLEKESEIHRHSSNRIKLIRFLTETGTSGRAYIEEARERTDTPVLVLPVG